MNLPKVHPAFKLNGVALDKQALLKRAQDLCNGGAPFEQDMGAFLLQWLNDGPTIQVQTSGATGTPKTISLKKEHMVYSAKATGTFFNAMEGTTALHCLPTKYIAGKMMLVRAMVLGWEVQYVQPDSSPLVSASGNFDFCAMVPLQLSNSSEQLKRLKTVIVGGAPMGMVLEDKVKELPTKIYGTYGMTETITHVAVRPVTRSAAEQHPFQRTTMVSVNHPGPSLFQALPNVAFSQDHRGCLVVSAPGVAASDVVTNDMVRLVSPTVFEWLGRYDHVINSGGIKLFPEQIETKLAPHIPSRFFVAGVPDVRLGQQMVLFLEGVANGASLLEQLKSLQLLESYEMPKKVVTVPFFEETPTGKVKRASIVKMHQ